eukprot:TRINITY_DN11567_c0_g1_i2.p1 TRINITY_DN11567_c0_g1~~TRINITY_DN11567_c0_g1_i2.p1  ORF type:complete len:716 (-),score=187.77 TRINITY_DN11567_c0_g1_i2:217-2364(-)
MRHFSSFDNLSADEDADLRALPPPPLLWRTETGRSAFPLPPGAASGAPPEAKLAFKTMQYLSMRTEDSSFIAAELASRMMGHRQMFKELLANCGDIRGVHVVVPATAASAGSASSAATVDLIISKTPDAEQLFRVRVVGLRITSASSIGSAPATPSALQGKVVGLGGFEPAPIDASDVPPALWAQMRQAASKELAAYPEDRPDPSHLAPPPPPQSLVRQSSMLSDGDLQDMDLVLTAAPVARHLFRMRFRLASGCKAPAAHYLLLLPRIQAYGAKEHPRYRKHEVRASLLSTSDASAGGSKSSSVGATRLQLRGRHFAACAVPGASVQRLVVEHEFTSCRVRLQPRRAANARDILAASEELSAEERCLYLADDLGQADRLRTLLAALGLARRPGERDIAYAVRLGRALSDGYKYDVEATEAHVQNLPPLIWEKRVGDCSAFNAGFVYALRAYGVPARVSLGFKYGSAVKQACGAVVAPHAQAEFYAGDIGWIPCDATLGVKRLGHDGGSVLSFVEWRSGNVALPELEELSDIVRAAGDAATEADVLQKRLESFFGTDALTAAELAKGVARARGLGKTEAEALVLRVLRAAELEPSGSVATAERFARLLRSWELGCFTELGGGSGAVGVLASCARAGAKTYESDRPPLQSGSPALDLNKLRENMMVPDDIDLVLGHVGGGGSAAASGHQAAATNWAAMWPHGVFLCKYEFEEKPLA